MKNRNIPYYVAALMLAAGVSTSFVSCVDTDEPETVTKLRQAAIEKIQADADLQKAYAEVQRAVAAKENASALVEKATAAYKDAETAVKNAAATAADYDNQIKAAGLDEAKQAEIEKQKAAVEEQKANAETQRAAAIANKLAADQAAATADADLKAAVAKALAEYAGLGNAKIQEAYVDYLNKVEAYGKAQDAYVEKEAEGKKDLASLTAAVAEKTTALKKAQEAKADVEAVYATEDYKTWEKDYKTAKEELVKAETKIISLLENKAESEAKLVKREVEVAAELTEWKKTTATYEIEMSAELAEQIKLAGETVVEKSTTSNLSIGDDTKIEVKYLNGKAKIFVGEGDKATVLVQNQDAEKVLRAVAKLFENDYGNKTDWDVKVKQTELNSYKDEYDKQSKKINGDANAESEADKKGLISVYKTAYDEYKYTNDEKKDAFVTAAQDLYGKCVDADGLVDGVKLSKDVPTAGMTDKKMLEEYNKNTYYGGTDRKWKEYGLYLYWKDKYQEKQKEVNTFGAGVTLYNTLIKKADALKDEKAAKEAENADKKATDETLLALQNEVLGIQDKIDDAKGDQTKYKAIANAIKKALGAKEAAQVVDKTEWVTDYDSPLYIQVPLRDKDNNPVLDKNGEPIMIDVLDGYRSKLVTYYKDKTDEDGNIVYNATISENIDIEAIKADVLSKLQKAIDDAQADLDAANEDVKNYNAGNRDSNAAVTRAKAKVDEAKAEMNAAKAYYDELVKIYTGKTE